MLKSDAQFTRDQNRTGNPSDPLFILSCVARHRFAWPGGYELSVVFNDGAAICQQCIRERYKEEYTDARDGYTEPVAILHSCEIDPGSFYCEHCSKDLSAYTEDGGE